MRVLVACEYSGLTRDAFIAKGHDAISCDLDPTDKPGPHYQGDVFDILEDEWDLMIAHPPCTYLSSSGLHWNNKIPGRAELTAEAINFVEILWAADIPKIMIENPVGCLSTKSDLGKPAQYIQPYEYGHDASKRTCLWLKNLPKLVPTGPIIEPRMVGDKKRWANQTDSGQNRLGPSATRGKDRSLTYEGWANAWADQWG